MNIPTISDEQKYITDKEQNALYAFAIQRHPKALSSLEFRKHIYKFARRYSFLDTLKINKREKIEKENLKVFLEKLYYHYNKPKGKRKPDAAEIADFIKKLEAKEYNEWQQFFKNAQAVSEKKNTSKTETKIASLILNFFFIFPSIIELEADYKNEIKKQQNKKNSFLFGLKNLFKNKSPVKPEKTDKEPTKDNTKDNTKEGEKKKEEVSEKQLKTSQSTENNTPKEVQQKEKPKEDKKVIEAENIGKKKTESEKPEEKIKQVPIIEPISEKQKTIEKKHTSETKKIVEQTQTNNKKSDEKKPVEGKQKPEIKITTEKQKAKVPVKKPAAKKKKQLSEKFIKDILKILIVTLSVLLLIAIVLIFKYFPDSDYTNTHTTESVTVATTEDNIADNQAKIKLSSIKSALKEANVKYFAEDFNLVTELNITDTKFRDFVNYYSEFNKNVKIMLMGKKYDIDVFLFSIINTKRFDIEVNEVKKVKDNDFVIKVKLNRSNFRESQNEKI